MILYLHGFGGNGLGKKATIIRKHYKQNAIALSVPNIPELAIDTLEQIIELLLEKKEFVYLVGSSAGGYLSIYLANKYNLKAVLINPLIHPHKLTRLVGFATNYYDGSSFECTSTHLESMKKYEVSHIKNQANFMLLLAKNDTVLNYKEALQKLPDAKNIIKATGGHEFTLFEETLPKIEEFFELES